MHTLEQPRAAAHPGVRYGVFLRPSARVAIRSLQAFDLCARMFGFIAARAYPPHVTLVGSINAAVPETQLIAVIDRALIDAPVQQITIEPIARTAGSSLHHAITDRTGGALRDLMGSLLAAVAPLRVFDDRDFGVERRRADAPERFRPHLSIVGHDGAQNPAEVDEALAYLTHLGLDERLEETWDAVVLYRLTSRDWSGPYWETMTWEVVRTWRLTHEEVR